MTTQILRHLKRAFALCQLLLLVSCQNTEETFTAPALQYATPTMSAKFVSQARATQLPPAATSTMIVPTQGSLTGEINSFFPTAAPDPIRFVFPTPRPAPKSAWRPPLYPTPWAPTPFDHFYFSRPIAADQINWPLASYRYGGVFFEDVVHTGVDIPAPIGTPVLAAGSGKVTWAGYGLYAQKEDPDDPYGLAVAIKHDFGYEGNTLYTVYGHMSELNVTRGQHVEGGEVLGLVGETGKVTGPHLHFEVRIGKNNFFGSRNPELWISPPQGWGVLVGRVMNTVGLLEARQSVRVYSIENDQWWEVVSYGHGSTNSDAYYQENAVLGDLPAGSYEISISYAGVLYTRDVEILPGMVTYFAFQGRKGFQDNTPQAPGADFSPTFSGSSSLP